MLSFISKIKIPSYKMKGQTMHHHKKANKTKQKSPLVPHSNIISPPLLPQHTFSSTFNPNITKPKKSLSKSKPTITLSSAPHKASGPPPRPSTTSMQEPSLSRQRSWSKLHSNDSPDRLREELWRKRKGSIKHRSDRKSVTDEDLDELKACIELGFGFESPTTNEVPDQRLSETFPALELLYAVDKQYNVIVSKSANATPLSNATPASSSAASDCDSLSPGGSPLAIFGPVKNPKTMKTRLRQWAQVVGVSVKQTSNK